ncbi:hypothetical protein PN498_00960 [Oscillatoria sp. CS-180]|uniref:hypothetical protein n=1 Tax=Oscillatoria sp. CS-180 TaxID=3021720 RepID=UPI002330021A|nr:hypothetical protein [Oscillatoria sp. CS-180]MDB9524543.1 hypothetical protein [Oscillatoria sp. CS-180]
MPSFPFERPILILLIGVMAFGMLGWGWYAGFTGGHSPGWHWLAVSYSYLDLPTLLLGIALVYLGPIFGGILLVLLLAAVLFPRRRQLVRRLAVSLGMIAGFLVMLLIAAAPSVLFGYSPGGRSELAAWHKTYRSVYTAPVFDDNYGWLMLLECGRFGWCSEVYRQYTAGTLRKGTLFSSPTEGGPEIAFNSNTHQMAVKLGGEWVFVRSRDEILCVAKPAPSLTAENEAVTCDFLER